MLLFFIIQLTHQCQINGYESGVCTLKLNITDSIEFCNSEVDDFICVPEFRILWPDHTIQNRDKAIRSDFVDQIRDRLVQEINGEVDTVLIESDDCYKAYKQFLCQWNFPACDSTTNQTKQICQSYCTSYYDSCGLNLTPCLQYFQKLVKSVQLLKQPGLDQNC